MKKWLREIACMLVTLGIVFSAGCGVQQTSTTADRLEVRNDGTAIQWKYSDETEWHDLVAIAELTGSAGENGTNGINGKDGTNGKNGVNGKDGLDGKDGTNGKTVEVKKTDLYIQWRYENGEWQNLVALADISGPSGQNGTNGENGKTAEFRVDGDQLQWRYAGDTVWLNLYDLSTLKGADGKDGSCAGYFAAGGEVYGLGTLSFTVKKESGDLISYDSSDKTITLSKGHSYSLVFSGTVEVSADGDDKKCGVSLIDGYNSSEMVLSTQTYMIIPKTGQSGRLTMAYNTVYTAEEDIALTFQYTKMLFMNTNFNSSQYNITVIALD